MNTNLSELRQRHFNDDVEKVQSNETQNLLIKIESRIRESLEARRDQSHIDLIKFNQDILKHCKWTIQSQETLSPELLNELECFSKKDLSQEISEIFSWIYFDKHLLSLKFFNAKFNNAKLSSSLKKTARIDKYLERTTLLFKSTTENYSDHEIAGYVKILVEFSRYSSLTSSKKIEPLLNYLERTDYSQFVLVIQKSLEIGGILASDFITALIFDKSLQWQPHSPLSSSTSRPTASLVTSSNKGTEKSKLENIERGLEVFLDNNAVTYNDHIVNVLFSLLEDIKYFPVIERVFNKAHSLELFDYRLRLLLQKIVREIDRKQLSRIGHVMQHILKNQRLLNRLHERPLLSTEHEGLFFLILKVHQWNELPESIKEKIRDNIFNPLLYSINSFIGFAEENIEEKILHVFLNIIAHEKQNCVEELKKSQVTLEGIYQLFKLLLARFNCRGIFNGEALRFLNFILDQFLQISQIKGTSSQMFAIIERMTNTFLEVKLDHLGSLVHKGAIQELYNKVSIIAQGIESFESLKQKFNLFENFFPSLLFALLFSDDDFKEWFILENPQIKSERMELILNERQGIREAIHRDYHLQLKKNGFEYIRNNQIGALAALQGCILQKHIFLKLGTGQGKSLIAELSAIRLLKSDTPPKRVFIFTSYDHLAKRDYEDMKFLSEMSGVPSIYISSDTKFSKNVDEIRNAKIFHIDSDHFHAFLSENFGEALDNKTDVSEFINIFFQQEKCAVILDEGDLMIMDHKEIGRLHNFKKTFGSAPINMREQKEAFDQIIGIELIDSLNMRFPNAYEKWYRETKACRIKERPSTHEASGKKTTYASSFSLRIEQGKYSFTPLLFNFPSYVRPFKDVLFLSGSIDENHLKSFDGFFTSKKHESTKTKETIFVNIPLFFGSHNQSLHLIERKKKGNLEESAWYAEIEEDIKQARNAHQPILLFGEESELKTLKDRLRARLAISDDRCISITNEEELKSHFTRIGERHSITFATTICGRGIDIKISKDIEAGLHVLITKLPDNYNERLLKQMIGRTSRLDRNGSVSIIVKENISEFERHAQNNRNQIIIERLEVSQKKFDLSKHFLSYLSGLRRDGREVAVKRWVLLSEIIRSNHIDLTDENVFESSKTFITTGT